MKRPSFQFYPGDWQANSNLRRCTRVERSVWLDVLCLMHDSEEYGVLLWPLKDIAEAANCKVSELKALRDKGVLKGTDKGERCAAFVYVPRSGRRNGDPVTLIEEQDGPIWYSSRMVKDEYVRTIRGESSRFSEDNGEPPKPTPKPSPKPPFDDGSSSSSSSSASRKTLGTPIVIGASKRDARDDFTPKDAAEWLRHFKAKHGFEADPTNVNDRKKLWPVFSGWVNAGLSASFVDTAVATAIARSRETIVCLPLYVDRFMANEQSARASPGRNERDASRSRAAEILTNVTVSQSHECPDGSFIDVDAKLLG